MPQLSFHGEDKALIFNSQCYSCISWIFPAFHGYFLRTLERGWLYVDVSCGRWGISMSLCTHFLLVFPRCYTGHGKLDGYDIPRWRCPEAGWGPQSLNGEVVSARGAAAHQQEMKCLRHSLSRVMKNSLFPSVKENHHKLVCHNLSFLFNKTVLPQFLCRKILGDPLQVSQCNWFNTGGRS